MMSLRGPDTALDKAIEVRDVLCRDLDLTRSHCAQLLSVVDGLRAELDTMDSDAVRLRAAAVEAQEQLAAERRDFVDAVQLVRRGCAAECLIIADENRRLATMLSALQRSNSEKEARLEWRFNSAGICVYCQSLWVVLRNVSARKSRSCYDRCSSDIF